MTSLSFPSSTEAAFVADASVVINLNATERAAVIIEALPLPVIVAINTLEELKLGAAHGHDDAAKLQELIAGGVVAVSELGDVGLQAYGNLIEGSAMRTLDDGEASTIGLALERNGVAVIDEKKGRSICAQQYPKLVVASTIDLLMLPVVEKAITRQGQIDAIVAALQIARMRVPAEKIEAVVGLIGDKEAANCASLPKGRRLRPA